MEYKEGNLNKYWEGKIGDNTGKEYKEKMIKY